MQLLDGSAYFESQIGLTQNEFRNVVWHVVVFLCDGANDRGHALEENVVQLLLVLKVEIRSDELLGDQLLLGIVLLLLLLSEDCTVGEWSANGCRCWSNSAVWSTHGYFAAATGVEDVVNQWSGGCSHDASHHHFFCCCAVASSFDLIGV